MGVRWGRVAVRGGCVGVCGGRRAKKYEARRYMVGHNSGRTWGPCGRAWRPDGREVAGNANECWAPPWACMQSALACLEAAWARVDAAEQNSSRHGAGMLGTTVGVRAGRVGVRAGRAGVRGRRWAKKYQTRRRHVRHVRGPACRPRGRSWGASCPIAFAKWWYDEIRCKVGMPQWGPIWGQLRLIYGAAPFRCWFGVGSGSVGGVC